MVNFWDSNLLQTLTIFIVGLSAFVIYIFKLLAERNRAAAILITEIRGIEEALKRLQEAIRTKDIYSSAPIIKGNSWEKYKFRFVKKLDQDEYSLISEFYSTACRIEEERSILVKQTIISFEAKCRAFHELVVAIAEQKYDSSDKEFLDACDKIVKKVCLSTPTYHSTMPQGLMSLLLHNIKYVTTSTACSKI